MKNIEVIQEGFVFDNKLPQLRSRHGYFPGLAMLEDGTLLSSFVVGEAFESVDLTTVLAKSRDNGRTWEIAGPVLDKSKSEIPVSDMLKITYAGNGRLIAAGYCFPRKDAGLPIGNPETGGVLDDEVICIESYDYGSSWSEVKKIDTSLKGPVEASAPVVLLKNGWLAAPVANFPKWDGKFQEPPCGRLLISRDNGKTWNDGSITMRFEERPVTVYEQRMCQLEDGRIAVIAWNEDIDSGKRLPNHFTISEDNGVTFLQPKSTGIMGQTSSVISLGGSRVLAFHCIRRDTDKPGIYAYIVDLSKGEWDILCEERVWGPAIQLNASRNMAEIFSCLRFGQPSAIPAGGNEFINEFLMVNWVIEDGQGKIAFRRLRIDL